MSIGLANTEFYYLWCCDVDGSVRLANVWWDPILQKRVGWVWVPYGSGPETDPIFTARLAGPPNISLFANDVPYLTTRWPETDPVFAARLLATPPLYNVYADWVTITGTGTLLDPFVAVWWTGGWHEIVDWANNVMPQEDQLKFTSKFSVTDEPLNTRTVVDLNPDQIFDTLGFTAEFDNGNSWAAKTIDYTIANNQKVTLTDNCVFAFTPIAWWVSRVQLKIIQDWTGWWNCFRPANVIRPNGYPTWTDWTPWQNCIITFYYDWTNYIAIATLYYDLP